MISLTPPRRRILHRVDVPEWRRQHRRSPTPTPRRRFAMLGYHFTCRSRCAARYVALTGCKWIEASKLFEINPGAIWLAYGRIYATETVQ